MPFRVSTIGIKRLAQGRIFLSSPHTRDEILVENDDIEPVKRYFFRRKTAIIYLSISLKMCFWWSKEPFY